VTGSDGGRSDPTGGLVCHVTGRAGRFSEIWIDGQVEGVERYRSTLWSLRQPEDPYYWRSRPRPLDRTDLVVRLANRLSRTRPVELGGSVVPDLARVLVARSRSVRAADVSLFHAHFGYLAYLWSGVSERTGIPLVASFYGVDASAERFQAPPWSGRYRTLFSLARRILVEGPHMARRLAGLGCPEEKIEVVRLPFAPPAIGPEDVRNREFAVVLGGRFVRKKGFDIALRAFATAFPRGREQLVFAGQGPEEHPLRRLAEELRIAERVSFRGPLPVGEFAALLQRSHVTLFPSVTAPNGDSEGGAPLTIPLAQALGVPIIVSDHDDLPWAAAPGTPVVRSGDAEELAAALADLYRASLARTPELTARLEAARRFVEEVHDPRRLAREREAVYDRALA
jgi:colanic acid/amylovoran biosynthesis glycosyltransferase